MSEQDTTAGTGTMPVFRLEKLYLKDLSFENPNAPESFFIQGAEPNAEMKLKLSNKKVDENHWEVCLEIEATVKDTKSDKVMFIIEIEHAGAFFMQNIPEEHINQVLNVDCPTILFPYTRQIASQASVDGGFMPFLMEPVNFMGMYQNKMQQQQEKQDS
jgi:preprotein translocase subunit SecB